MFIKSKIRKYRNVVLILIITLGSGLLISFESSLLRLDFSGFNALYISKSEDFHTVNWITTISDSGIYKVRQGTKILQEGKTKLGKIHHIRLKNDLKNYDLEFGGMKTGEFSISIHDEQKQESSIVKDVDSIYVLGDIHGEYEKLVTLLKNSKIIDEDLNWIAGKAHLVFLGDLFDRGKKVTHVLWFIYKLEQSAFKNGGKVHVVLGNHEIMVMTKDLRYVSAKERGIAKAHQTTYDHLFHPEKSVLGNWLKHKTSVLQIDDILFAHGGIIDMQEKSLNEFNSKAFNHMNKPMFLDLIQDYPDTLKYDKNDWIKMRNFFFKYNSPYWFRGFVTSDTLEIPLQKTLDKFKATTHVVAHTALNSIEKRYNGKLLATDLLLPATQILFIEKSNGKIKNYTVDSYGKKIEL